MKTAKQHNAENFDLGQMLFDQANALNHQFTIGLKAGKEISEVAHRALKVAYELAQQDAETKIPTPLSCAIENILRLGS